MRVDRGDDNGDHGDWPREQFNLRISSASQTVAGIQPIVYPGKLPLSLELS
jgi:hypothetical protein